LAQNIFIAIIILILSNYHHSAANFFIQGEFIWRLSQLRNPKDYEIKIYEKVFYFTKAQLLFLSSAAFKHFKHNSNLFELIPPSSFQENEAISCFNSLYSLFFDSISIEINASNQSIFQFFGKKLDNRSLSKACRVSLNSARHFSLSFARFSDVPMKTINSLNDFEIKINENSYQCNSSFLNCLSYYAFNQFQLEQIPEIFTFSVSDELIPVFETIFDPFSGKSIYLEQFPIDYFLDSIEILKITAGRD
jgi:hypothetical protein